MDEVFKSDSILEIIKKKNENIESVKEVITNKYMIFSLEEKYFAMEGKNIKEVNSIDKIFFFPQVDSWLRGLVNIRGDVHSIFGLKEALLIERNKEEEMHALYTSPIATTSIAIDSIVDVLDVPEDSITIYNSGDNDLEFLTGVFQYKNEEIIIIDIIKIIKELNVRLNNQE